MEDKYKKMCDANGLGHDCGREFLESLRKHIAYVGEAGRRLGVPEDQLTIHDESKFSAWEFPHYARHFHGSASPVDSHSEDIGFASAWLHHQNVNPHHWEYWVPRSGEFKNAPLEMPERYVREMVADWQGASRVYTGSLDMSNWLNGNLDKMRLNAKTRQLVIEVLAETKHGLAWGKFEFDG